MEREMVKPALWAGPNEWSWVDMQDIAHILGENRLQLWENFIALSWGILENKLDWSRDLVRVENTFDLHALQSPDIPVYVPAGWAEEVLNVHKLGAVRVESVLHEHDDFTVGCPAGSVKCCHMPVTESGRSVTRVYAVVGLDANGNPINACVRKAKNWEYGCCPACLGNRSQPYYKLRMREDHERMRMCTKPSEDAYYALQKGWAFPHYSVTRQRWTVVFSAE